MNEKIRAMTDTELLRMLAVQMDAQSRITEKLLRRTESLRQVQRQLGAMIGNTLSITGAMSEAPALIDPLLREIRSRTDRVNEILNGQEWRGAGESVGREDLDG